VDNLKNKIKEAYTGIVEPTPKASSCCGSGSSASGNSCCETSAGIAGFSEDYSGLPGYVPDADFGLGCGIPVAFAGIKEGDTVLDLGSGAGNDAFVARSLTGPRGKVIGIDMTPAMIGLANRNKEKTGFGNVEFILADIENIPLPENSVDTVISNCVLNLVSDKKAAFGEIFKVLKPGGHFCISDVVLLGQLTKKMSGLAELYAGCIAGAMIKQEYLKTILESGFLDIEIKEEKIIYLPDSFLIQYLSMQELIEFRSSGVQILSITVNGKKP